MKVLRPWGVLLCLGMSTAAFADKAPATPKPAVLKAVTKDGANFHVTFSGKLVNAAKKLVPIEGELNVGA